jgi:hypothetical protein
MWVIVNMDFEDVTEVIGPFETKELVYQYATWLGSWGLIMQLQAPEEVRGDFKVPPLPQ